MNKMEQGGQIAIMVLLVSAVALTLGLSMSRKTTVETRVDTDEGSLKRAFNAAESGVEYYLGTGRTDYAATDNKSVAKITVETLGGGETVASSGVVLEGAAYYFWLVGHDGEGTINYSDDYDGDQLYLCMEEKTPQPTVLVNYFWGEFGGLGLAKVDIRRRWQTPGSGLNCGGGYREVNLNDLITLGIGPGKKPLLLSVTPISGSGRIYLGGNANFPSQGTKISSEGSYDLVRRKVSVERRFVIPGFFLDPIVAASGVLSQ